MGARPRLPARLDVAAPDLTAGNCQTLRPSLTNVNGTLFFVANDGTHGLELWKSDGTASGTVMVMAALFSANPYFLTDVNGTLFFTATDGTNGIELWKSDGTLAGTVMVLVTVCSPDILLHSTLLPRKRASVWVMTPSCIFS